MHCATANILVARVWKVILELWRQILLVLTTTSSRTVATAVVTLPAFRAFRGLDQINVHFHGARLGVWLVLAAAALPSRRARRVALPHCRTQLGCFRKGR